MPPGSRTVKLMGMHPRAYRSLTVKERAQACYRHRTAAASSSMRRRAEAERISRSKPSKSKAPSFAVETSIEAASLETDR